MKKLDSSKLYRIDEVNILEPAFDGFTGWLTVSELNLLDPQCYRFDVLQEVDFEDGTTFAFVNKYVH